MFNTSVAADIGAPWCSLYGASKGAAHAMARSLAAELLAQGIRVNIVSPGPTETPILGKSAVTCVRRLCWKRGLRGAAFLAFLRRRNPIWSASWEASRDIAPHWWNFPLPKNLDDSALPVRRTSTRCPQPGFPRSGARSLPPRTERELNGAITMENLCRPTLFCPGGRVFGRGIHSISRILPRAGPIRRDGHSGHR